MDQLSRRRFLGLAGAAGLAGVAGAAGALAGHHVVERAHSFDPAGVGSLADVEHIVLLMQENRSFDHYFGTMSGVRGFDTAGATLEQAGYRPGHGPDPTARLMPFHLDTTHRALDGDILNDPGHDWAVQHEVWNQGRMDRWVSAHLRADGAVNGPLTMGYYTRADIPTHYALADAFTVCDHYFSSALGPTAPNRLFWMTGGIDAEGSAGGPIIGPAAGLPPGSLSWRTYAENLDEGGVSWKVYNHAPPDRTPELSGMLGHFRAFADPHSRLYQRGRAPRYPHDFAHDVAHGALPAVSWLIPSMDASEHPAHPPAVGAAGIVEVLDLLTANPAVWEKTALIVSFDENGGLFDHVAPPTPPPATPGEYVTATATATATATSTATQRPTAARPGPVGLGFRVPALVLSPYTRGGYVTSEVLDHTSQLRLIEARFGVPVPNVSSWRRGVVGDLTSVFRPRRPAALWVPDVMRVRAAAEASLAGDAFDIRQASRGRGQPYPVTQNVRPVQARTPVRRRLGPV